MAEETGAPPTSDDSAPAEKPAAPSAPPCSFFKKPKRDRNIRKRERGNDEEQEGSAVVHKAKVGRKGGFSTSSSSKQKVDDTTPEDTPGKNTIFFESSREIQTNDNFATATLETETEFDKDARAMREKVLKAATKRAERDRQLAENGGKQEAQKPEVYRGMNAYTDHRAGFRRENSIAEEKMMGAHGPLRANQSIRMSARFDYQPDVCKDYKETGYCGYGDSCKFMHDRGDYKAGWELDLEWEAAQKAKKERLERQMRGLLEEGDGEEDEDDDDDLPFACFICREPFVDPVVTTCKHYFCEHCALKHHKADKSCAACKKPTNGIFNVAHEVIKKLKKKK